MVPGNVTTLTKYILCIYSNNKWVLNLSFPPFPFFFLNQRCYTHVQLLVLLLDSEVPIIDLEKKNTAAGEMFGFAGSRVTPLLLDSSFTYTYRDPAEH
jgi:hypothetical protein